MASTEDFLWEVVKKIEPSSARKDGAQRSHKFFREILRTGQFEARVVDDYLSGSYARGTAINPLEDVDIIFVIDPNCWQTKFATLVGSRPRPGSVLSSFQQAIKYRYPDSSVVLQRRSVGLRMHHLHIDVVPAIANHSKPDHLWIPDRRAEDWILSGPRVHAKQATLVNDRNGARFKPLVKLLKYWNQGLPSTAKVRSFTIETLAVRIFSAYAFDSLEEGLLKFFDFIVWVNDEETHLKWRDQCGVSFFWGRMNVPDVADTGGNVAAGVESTRRKRFAEKARISRNRVLDAMQAPTNRGARSRMKAALGVT